MAADMRVCSRPCNTLSVPCMAARYACMYMCPFDWYVYVYIWLVCICICVYLTGMYMRIFDWYVYVYILLVCICVYLTGMYMCIFDWYVYAYIWLVRNIGPIPNICSDAAEALLEFDPKRVRYSYAPGYDALKETLARGSQIAPASGGGGCTFLSGASSI